MHLSNKDISDLFPYYERWIAEGKPKHGGAFYSAGERIQHYYDPYHTLIEKQEDGTYRFDIQVYDSPEGDTWVEGVFKVDEYGVKILKQRGYGR